MSSSNGTLRFFLSPKTLTYASHSAAEASRGTSGLSPTSREQEMVFSPSRENVLPPLLVEQADRDSRESEDSLL